MQPTKGPHTDHDKARNIGKACHIHAAAKGGPRYDDNQTPEERSDARNGIWLCSDHATEIDVDPARFPAELLKRWKADADHAADLRMNSPATASAVAALGVVTQELLGTPQTLPDGTWLPRPEMDRIRAAIEGDDPGVVALLGPPGSGKSAFLARLGCTLRDEGWNVVAIKADRLPATIVSLGDLARLLGLEIPLTRATYALSRRGKTVLLVDQLDALSDLTDAKTERLAVVLSLISSVAASGVPTLCSVRKFDFEHDTRFSQLDAQEVQLAAVADDDVDDVLRKIGFEPARAGPKLRSVLRLPYWLKLFVKLAWNAEAPLPTTSQALLERIWQETVLLPGADAAENDAVASRIATTISDCEDLWVLRAELSELEAPLQRLLAKGVLATDASGMRVSFAHQCLYEFARARTLVRGASLTEYVSAKNSSLFVRPTIWTTLQYLRVADTARYRRELAGLWNPAPRAHIRLLLIDFVGQVEAPDDVEIALLQPLFQDREWARAAFIACSRSAAWLRLLRRAILPRAMVGPNADCAYAAVVASLKLDRDETLALMARYWGGKAAHAGLVVGVLRQLDDWGVEARDLLDDALPHIEGPLGVLDTFSWSLKEKAPAYAIDLIVRHLVRGFAEQETKLPRSEALAADAPFAEELRWHREREPARTAAEVFRSASSIHTLVDLAEAAPEGFLRGFLPWTASVLKYVAETYAGQRAYAIDGSCDCSKSVGGTRELPHALRAASEAFASANPAGFLELSSEWSSSELQTIHVIFSYGLERLGRSNAHDVAVYLLGDARRLQLGEVGDHDARTLALLRSIRDWVSGADVRLLEAAILATRRSSESDDKPPKARWAARQLNREHRLRLLQALPSTLLSTEGASRLEQECRVFGEEEHRSRRSTGFREIGSPMSAHQMEGAADGHILGLFEELPDSTEFRHPTRFMEGGAVEAGREFAAFAKRQPQRAVRIIGRLNPGRNEIPVGDAIQALGETDLATQDLCELVEACWSRGFASEQFKTDAARALARRAGSSGGLPEPILKLLREWLGEVPLGPRTKALVNLSENSGSSPFLRGSGGFISLPGGSYAILDACLVGFLSAKPSRAAEWIALLLQHVERDEDPLVWRAFAHRLEHLGRCDGASVTQFLIALFARYPEVLESGPGVVLVARASWWVEPAVVEVWVAALRKARWEHAQSAAGELTAFLATRSPALPWAEGALLDATGPDAIHEQAVGAAHGLMYFWRDPAFRGRACPHVCALATRGDAAVDAILLGQLAHDDIGADDLAVEVLSAFATRAAPLPGDNAHDAVSWLALLVQASPAQVLSLAASLVSAAESNRDAPQRLGGAAVELVNMALTLQRMPEFREQGLVLFERLLALDLYGARGLLEEIDAARG